MEKSKSNNKLAQLRQKLHINKEELLFLEQKISEEEEKILHKN